MRIRKTGEAKKGNEKRVSRLLRERRKGREGTEFGCLKIRQGSGCAGSTPKDKCILTKNLHEKDAERKG